MRIGGDEHTSVSTHARWSWRRRLALFLVGFVGLFVIGTAASGLRLRIGPLDSDTTVPILDPVTDFVGGQGSPIGTLAGVVCPTGELLIDLIAPVDLLKLSQTLIEPVAVEPVCLLAKLKLRYRTVYRAPSGSEITRTVYSDILIPTPLNVDGDSAFDMIARVNLPSLQLDRAQLIVELAGGQAPLPVQFEAIVGDVTGGEIGRDEVAFGYDTRSEVSPTKFDATLVFGAQPMNLNLITTNAPPTMPMIVSAYNGTHEARTDVESGRVRLTPFPQNLNVAFALGDRSTFTVKPSVRTRADIDVLLEDGEHRRTANAVIKDLPLQLDFALDSAAEGGTAQQIVMMASQHMDQVTVAYRDQLNATAPVKGVDLDVVHPPKSADVRLRATGVDVLTGGGSGSTAPTTVDLAVLDGERRQTAQAALEHLPVDLAFRLASLNGGTTQLIDASGSEPIRHVDVSYRDALTPTSPVSGIDLDVANPPLATKALLRKTGVDIEARGGSGSTDPTDVDVLILAGERRQIATAELETLPTELDLRLDSAAEDGKTQLVAVDGNQSVGEAVVTYRDKLTPAGPENGVDMTLVNPPLAATALLREKSVDVLTDGGSGTTDPSTADLTIVKGANRQTVHGTLASIPNDFDLFLVTDPLVSIRTKASERIASGKVLFRDFKGQVDPKTTVDATLTDIPTAMNVQQLAKGVDVTMTEGPLGAAHVIFANNTLPILRTATTSGALAIVNDQGTPDPLDDILAVDARATKITRVLADMSDAPDNTKRNILEAELERQPFVVRFEDRATNKTYDARVDNLPAHTRLVITPTKANFDGFGTGIGFAEIELRDDQPFVGDGNRLRARAWGIPATEEVTWTPPGAPETKITSTPSIDTVEILVTGGTFEPTLPASGSAVVADFRPSVFSIAARASKVKSFSLKPKDPLRIGFDSDVSQKLTLDLETPVYNTSTGDNTTVRGTIDAIPAGLFTYSLGGGETSYSAQAAIDSVTVDIFDLPHTDPDDIQRVHVEANGLPKTLGINLPSDEGPEGFGLNAGADDIDRLYIQANDAGPLPTVHDSENRVFYWNTGLINQAAVRIEKLQFLKVLPSSDGSVQAEALWSPAQPAPITVRVNGNGNDYTEARVATPPKQIHKLQFKKPTTTETFNIGPGEPTQVRTNSGVNVFYDGSAALGNVDVQLQSSSITGDVRIASLPQKFDICAGAGTSCSKNTPEYVQAITISGYSKTFGTATPRQIDLDARFCMKPTSMLYTDCIKDNPRSPTLQQWVDIDNLRFDDFEVEVGKDFSQRTSQGDLDDGDDPDYQPIGLLTFASNNGIYADQIGIYDPNNADPDKEGLRIRKGVNQGGPIRTAGGVRFRYVFVASQSGLLGDDDTYINENEGPFECPDPIFIEEIEDVGPSRSNYDDENLGFDIAEIFDPCDN